MDLFLGGWTMEDASYGLHGMSVQGQVTMVVINKLETVQVRDQPVSRKYTRPKVHPGLRKM
jgi:hypothetical protein